MLKIIMQLESESVLASFVVVVVFFIQQSLRDGGK